MPSVLQDASSTSRVSRAVSRAAALVQKSWFYQHHKCFAAHQSKNKPRHSPHKESWDSHCQAISPTPGRADQKTTAQMSELDAAVQARLKEWADLLTAFYEGRIFTTSQCKQHNLKKLEP